MLRRVVQLGIVLAVLGAASGSVAAAPDRCTIPVENVGFVTGSKPMWATGHKSMWTTGSKPMWATGTSKPMWTTGSKPMWAPGTELPTWEDITTDGVASPRPVCTTTP